MSDDRTTTGRTRALHPREPTAGNLAGVVHVLDEIGPSWHWDRDAALAEQQQPLHEEALVGLALVGIKTAGWRLVVEQSLSKVKHS